MEFQQLYTLQSHNALDPVQIIYTAMSGENFTKLALLTYEL